MKITIDDDVCAKYGTTPLEMFVLIFLKYSSLQRIDPFMYIKDMITDKKVFENSPATMFHGPTYYPVPVFDEKLQRVIIDSDTAMPKDSEFDILAKQIQDKFPPGKLEGTIYYYRGQTKNVAHHLKKWWKIFNVDKKYTSEDILNATDRYVAQFVNSKQGMRLCQYFILKDDRRVDQDGKGYVEQISDLSTILENPDEDASTPYNLVI